MYSAKAKISSAINNSSLTNVFRKQELFSHYCWHLETLVYICLLTATRHVSCGATLEDRGFEKSLFAHGTLNMALWIFPNISGLLAKVMTFCWGNLPSCSEAFLTHSSWIFSPKYNASGVLSRSVFPLEEAVPCPTSQLGIPLSPGGWGCRSLG